MGQVYIRNVRMHAYHGVLPQERVVGNDYVVNLEVDYPIGVACDTDNVADTMNYAVAAEVIRREMCVQSNLLEHVANRIADAIIKVFPLTERVMVDIEKIAPPMSVDCDGAGVRIVKENSR